MPIGNSWLGFCFPQGAIIFKTHSPNSAGGWHSCSAQAGMQPAAKLCSWSQATTTLHTVSCVPIHCSAAVSKPRCHPPSQPRSWELKDEVHEAFGLSSTALSPSAGQQEAARHVRFWFYPLSDKNDKIFLCERNRFWLRVLYQLLCVTTGHASSSRPLVTSTPFIFNESAIVVSAVNQQKNKKC